MNPELSFSFAILACYAWIAWLCRRDARKRAVLFALFAFMSIIVAGRILIPDDPIELQLMGLAP